MKLKFGNINNLFGAYVALFGATAILIAMPFSYNELVHIGTLAIFFGCLIQFANAMICKCLNSSITTLIVLAIYVSFCILVYSIKGKVSYVDAITFLELPLLLSISTIKTNYSKFIFIVQITFLSLSFYFLYLSFTDYAYRYMTIYGIRYVEDLTLGFNNPNETGMYLFICFVIVLHGFYSYRKRIIKTLFLIATSVDLILIFKTKSRICIIISVICIIYVFFLKDKKITSIYRYLAIIFSFIYVPITFLLNSQFSKWVILGETVETGRISVYSIAIEKIKQANIITGDLSYGFQNYHNAPLTIITTIGLLGAVLYYTLIIKSIKIIEGGLHEHLNRLSYIALTMVFFHSSVESAFLTGGSVYSILVFILYVFSINNYSLNRL